jgi:hypothetical protein
VNYSIWLKDRQQAFWHRCRGSLCWISIFYPNPSFILKIKISSSRVDMVYTRILDFFEIE